MKVAIITSGLLPVPAQKGGAVENLIDYYIDYNERVGIHDFDVYSVLPPRPVADGKHVRYIYVDSGAFWYRLKRNVYARFARNGYYDAFLMYFLRTILPSVVAGNYDRILLENRPGYVLELSRETNVPLYVHLHTDTMYKGGNALDGEVCKKVTKIIAVSDYIRNRVLSIGEDVNTKTCINGIDCSRFTLSTSVNRKQLGFSDDDFVVVYFGRIDEIKGVRELMQAIYNLRDEPSVKLLIIGSNTFSDVSAEDSYLQSLKAIAENMPEKVRFTGFVPYNEIPSYLKACDASVLPSLCDDACPLSVIEAMACGLPLVSTYAGGIPELCGEAGILLQRDDTLVANLTETIRRLYKDKEYCSQVGKSCLERSMHFDKDLFAASFLEELG